MLNALPQFVLRATLRSTRQRATHFALRANAPSPSPDSIRPGFPQIRRIWKFGTEKIPLKPYVKKMSGRQDFPLQKTEEEWRRDLDADEYCVLREKGTEMAGTGEYDKFFPDPDEGFFECRGCQRPLYSAAAKFNSGCGWPAFDKCYKGALRTEVDGSLGVRRIEIMCSNCGGHLGHVFEGEGFTETNERHCVNSLSVRFVKYKDKTSGAEISGVEESIISSL